MVPGSRRHSRFGGLFLALTVIAVPTVDRAVAEMPDGWSYTPHSAANAALPAAAPAHSAAPAHAPRGATARCKDGRWSHLRDRHRACRGHGGVARWL